VAGAAGSAIREITQAGEYAIGDVLPGESDLTPRAPSLRHSDHATARA